MKSKYFAWKLQRKITKRISNIRWIFDWRPPPSSFQRERTSDSLSELLQIARQKALEMFCCEQRGMRRKRRERRSQADGRNKWRQSVEEVRGSDKLSTARQPKSLSQSITFFPPLLSVCLIDFFFYSSWKPDSNDCSGVFWSEISVRKIWWFVSPPNGWTVKVSQKFYPGMPLFRQAYKSL